uniref:Uncharacterized protein n=1 Tax=Lactuca sativa TaxID=4236 RepID=A0A9R1XWJ2_LACSA|nr:hypothetical protein LSAT_V11C200060070 [Lactuca sativa]
MHIDDYIVVFENDKNAISEALIFYETHAIRKYWMIILTLYGVIVLLFKKRRIFNVFPTLDFPNHPIINIAFFNSCRYIKFHGYETCTNQNVLLDGSRCITLDYLLMFDHVDNSIIVVPEELMYQIIKEM